MAYLGTKSDKKCFAEQLRTRRSGVRIPYRVPKSSRFRKKTGTFCIFRGVYFYTNSTDPYADPYREITGKHFLYKRTPESKEKIRITRTAKAVFIIVPVLFIVYCGAEFAYLEWNLLLWYSTVNDIAEEGTVMTQKETVEKTVANAAASVEMEGYRVDAECRDWCRMLLLGEITFDQYLALAKKKAGVSAS